MKTTEEKIQDLLGYRGSVRIIRYANGKLAGIEICTAETSNNKGNGFFKVNHLGFKFFGNRKAFGKSDNYLNFGGREMFF